MPERRIVQGQFVREAKAARARELRRVMTPAEEVLWRALRTNRLEGWHFRRQQVIDGLIVDFYCHAAGLVVEVDGPIHDERLAYDDARDAILRGRDLRVIRLPNAAILSDIESVLTSIVTALQRLSVPSLWSEPTSRPSKAAKGTPFPAREGGRGVRS